ncbi:MAG: GTPase HflX [Planctomycetes bacterium]|nr:GTPase HflX [Planctomycetota bacterium]MBI3835422.1 GTPase HflX [Planctomycetota bacterium]
MRHSIRSYTPGGNRSGDSSRPPREPKRDVQTRTREKAVLVAVLLPHTKVDLRDPLGELAALAGAAGVEVADQMIQKRLKPDAAFALGTGKVEELLQRVTDSGADVVIFDNDLAPRQIRGLEEAVQRKVIDRSELILDIFASRARTHEAQLQVELAQLQYTAPRLRGMWTHLERIAGAGGGTAAGAVGGVGTRGPGERQIELDRRVVRDRISFLRRELDEIDHRKQREVRTRTEQYTVSLVGYTNSGKSTLMNRLTDAGAFVADMLFATLDTKTTRWELGEGQTVLLSDTIGFIRDLPHHLVASFRATLEETIHADLLLHVIDVSSPSAWQQMESVDEVLHSLGCDEVPQILLLNKIDMANDMIVAEMMARHHADVFRISALNGDGVSELVDEVARRARRNAVEATVLIPHSEGKLLTEVLRWADVTRREYNDEGVELHLLMNRDQLAQLRGRHPSLQIIENGESMENGSP